ncbi:MAG TPA: dienelactone hydrolase family protein [Tepidisphaeraceae bacterium]|jgi:pimeloyl-ACP methyl ester carboxylesterase|nr:dienelactone hydrolase family protein [Tepidisphaeraceae bacterium]
MQRPIMNPIFPDASKSKIKQKVPLWKRIVNLPNTLIGLLLADIFFWRSNRLRIEEGTVIGRVFQATLYRLLFVPLFTVLVVLAMVYLATHPPKPMTTADPLSQGIYYDPIQFKSADGTDLEGWLVPIIDANLIIEQREKALRAKFPAVILVHDYGSSRLQMLPIVQSLHEAGYVLLVPTLRGTATSNGASTFGIKEAADVQGAIQLLKKRNGIDSTRIAVLGIGTGANAAIIAAGHERVAALVLDHPVRDDDQIVRNYLGPPPPWSHSMNHLCKWTFEVAFRVDAEELDLERHAVALAAQPVLMFDTSSAPNSFRTQGKEDIKTFLARYIGDKPKMPTAGIDMRR